MQQQAITLQAEDWFDIEPNDRYNFVGDTQKNPQGYEKAALFVGTGGSISLRSACGMDKVFKNIPNGTFIPVSCVRVNSTGTNASDIIGVVQKSELKVI